MKTEEDVATLARKVRSMQIFRRRLVVPVIMLASFFAWYHFHKLNTLLDDLITSSTGLTLSDALLPLFYIAWHLMTMTFDVCAGVTLVLVLLLPTSPETKLLLKLADTQSKQKQGAG